MDVTKWDVLRLTSVYVISFLTSGAIVGYQGILPVLVDEKIFGSLCDDGTNDCNEQLLRLDLMYNITIAGANISGVIWGFLSLVLKPKHMLLIAAALVIPSCIVFSFGWDWGCFVSYFTFGLGCMGLVMSIIVVPAGYKPSIQGFLFSIMVASFDGSSGVFYLFYLLYEYANISMQAIFIGYAIICTVLLLIIYFYAFGSYFENKQKEFNEKQQIQSDSNNNEIDDDASSDAGTKTTQDADALAGTNIQVENNQLSANLLGQANKMTMNSNTLDHSKIKFSELFTNIIYYSIQIWSMFYMMTKYFYVQTMEKQLKWISGTENSPHEDTYVKNGAQIFTVMLACGGVFTVITGPILDGLGIKISFIIMGFVSLISAILSVIKVKWVQYITMVGYTYNRFFYFAMAPLITTVVYGQARQQFMWGWIAFISGLFTLTGYFWDWLITKKLNDNYMWPNIGLGIACLIAALWLAAILRGYKNVS